MTYPGWLRLSLLALVLLASGLVFRAAAAPPATPAPPAAAAEPQQADAEQQAKVEAEKKAKAEAQRQKKINAEKRTQTLADIRRLGTALYTWLKDQVAATVAEREAESAAAGEPPPQDPDVVNAKRQTYDVQDNPLISREDLEDFLVPDYLAQIPETDGWGNPYEVRINTDNLMARTVISIRSPGRKGYYSGDVYKVGGFDPTDFDQDIVWADGFFVRSPQSPEPVNLRPAPAPPGSAASSSRNTPAPGPPGSGGD